MCSVAVRAGRGGRGMAGHAGERGVKEELPARHGRGRNLTAIWKVDFVVLLWPVFLCHAKAKRDPLTSSYFYDSGGEKVVGWEGQTKLRY